jgi:adenosylcobinamide-phosphate synthase
VTNLISIILALAIDHWCGEPRAQLHPVAWMGHYLRHAGHLVQQAAQCCRLGSEWVVAGTCGSLAWLIGACTAVAGALALDAGIREIAEGVHVPAFTLVATGLLLKPFFAWSMLVDEVCAVERALDSAANHDLEASRQQLARLVSRDVSRLSASEIRESAIESLSENFNDSVIAPLFWFVVAGLPGAVFYRFCNTADAMWGYRGWYGGSNWEWAGKCAARADDILSWLPARLSALAILIAGGRWQPKRLWREASRTASPNSGWPMAATAIVLGCSLGKPNAYRLCADCASPAVGDVARTVPLLRRALRFLVAVGLAAALAAWMVENGSSW